ncbi:MAG: LysR substrate-binding domain-containing protein [Aliidongia sp.]
MTLDQLRIFVAVATRLHVTQAAHELNLTQSAASAAIAALETQYRTLLFHRIGRRIELTEAGRLFLGEARAVLQRAGEAELMLSELAGLRRGKLAVAASQTISNYWLPPVLWRYRQHYPNIELTLSIGNTEHVARAILGGSAELGFIEGAVEDTALRQTDIAVDELTLVVAPGHRWISTPPAGSADLAAGPWVLREAGSGTRQVFEADLGGLGLKPADLRVALELPSNEAVCSAVEAGAGATVVSHSVVAAALQAGRLCRVPLELPPRRYALVRHGERYLSRAAQALQSLILRGEPAG